MSRALMFDRLSHNLLARRFLLHQHNHKIKCPTAAAFQCYHSKQGVFGFNPSKSSRSRSSSFSQTYSPEDLANRSQLPSVLQLVEAYRSHGHKKASLDPLGLQNTNSLPELDVSLHGVEKNLSQVISTQGIFGGQEQQLTVNELINKLDQVYCGTVGVEFQHLSTLEERQWFAESIESGKYDDLASDRKVALAQLMLRCQEFDHFVATKFATVKRYGGEGGESMMGFFDEVFQRSTEHGIKNIVMCMPHRGRLNFLTCLLQMPPVLLFRKMKGLSELPVNARGIGDVLSHFYTSVDLSYSDKSVHVSMIPNPSHLEACCPVAMGKTRAKQRTGGYGHYGETSTSDLGNEALCLQVHGDASFAGQGVIAESFCFADVPNFEIGGSIHLIVNNQVGFTTESDRGRSSQYCSDIAKVNNYPVLHVNADFPENVVKAATIAVDYRQKFGKDIVIDLHCFRKWGHNEIDDPSFTQPIMYKAVNSRDSIPDSYAQNIVAAGLSDNESLDNTVKDWKSTLNDNLASSESYAVPNFHLQNHWSSIVQAGDSITTWDTGVDIDTLKFVGAKSVAVPDDLNVHPTIQKTHIDRRVHRLTEGKDFDWATAEALAMGSLLHQGFSVRISGQDVGRGTFSHRHCMVVDQDTDHMYIPLNSLSPDQTAFLEVANSALSEEGVLGFEYGVSLDHPDMLVIWEAQFGDFFNAAQTMIDTYVSCGELKWLLQSGMVMLLPHGMDGAGPEHSSCRLERFLQICDSHEDKIDGDDVNMQVAFPTTPAQYFHLLRRQMIRNFRKPLVVASPKAILRLAAATSSLADMLPGTHFQPVLADPKVDPGSVTRVVLCSGKHYYSLVTERETRAAHHIAFVRLESLCPFPVANIQAALQLYPKAKEFIWSQEEHRNMGAWSFVSPRFSNLVGQQLTYAGRDVLGCPAVGISTLHKQEIVHIMNQTFS